MKRISPKQRDQIAILYENKKKVNFIAKKFGVTPATIVRNLIIAGVYEKKTERILKKSGKYYKDYLKIAKQQEPRLY